MRTKKNEYSSFWDKNTNRSFVTDYFLYLGSKIVDFALGDGPWMTNKNLCWQLFNTEFYYASPYDESRVKEGLSLREYFLEDEFGVMAGDDRLSPEEKEFLNTPMSVLEVMCGMAHWCEERITYVHGEDKRSCWFEAMLRNLGFEGICDENYSAKTAALVDRNIHIAMNHEDDIEIGFWTTEMKRRTPYWGADLWAQMGQWMNENYFKNGQISG